MDRLDELIGITYKALLTNEQTEQEFYNELVDEYMTNSRTYTNFFNKPVELLLDTVRHAHELSKYNINNGLVYTTIKDLYNEYQELTRIHRLIVKKTFIERWGPIILTCNKNQLWKFYNQFTSDYYRAADKVKKNPYSRIEYPSSNSTKSELLSVCKVIVDEYASSIRDTKINKLLD